MHRSWEGACHYLCIYKNWKLRQTKTLKKRRSAKFICKVRHPSVNVICLFIWKKGCFWFRTRVSRSELVGNFRVASCFKILPGHNSRHTSVRRPLMSDKTRVLVSSLFRATFLTQSRASDRECVELWPQFSRLIWAIDRCTRAGM